MQMRQQYVEEIPLPKTLINTNDINNENIYIAFGFDKQEIHFVENFIEDVKMEILNELDI